MKIYQTKMYLSAYFIVLDISSDENIPNKNVFM